MTAIFVNRNRLTEKGDALLHALTGGQGGAALAVIGDSGMGMTSGLEHIAERARGEGVRVVLVRCAPVITRGSRFGPVWDALLELDAGSGAETWWRKSVGWLRRVVGAGAPAAVSAAVPAFGGAIVAVHREITKEAIETGALAEHGLLLSDGMIARRLASVLLKQAGDGDPVLLIIDDLQFADHGTLELLHLLVPRLPEASLGLVLGLGSYASYAENGEVAQELVAFWRERADARLDVEELGQLDPVSVREWVHTRLAGQDVPPGFAGQVASVTGGRPVFIDQVLKLWRPGYGVDVPLPERLPDAFEQRLAQLDPQERELLVIGATMGRFFFPHTLAKVSGLAPLQVRDILHRIEKSHGLIRERRRVDLPDWAARLHVDWYEFEHQLLQRGIYGEQSEGARLLRHCEIADALPSITRSPSVVLPREVQALIAEQLRRAGPARALACAEAYLRLARGLAGEDLAFAQAEQSSRAAIEALRQLPEGDRERDRLFAEAVDLLLFLSEVRWRGGPAGRGEEGIDALAAEAEAAAHRVGDPLLVARMTLQRGKTLMVVDGLWPALEKLEEAVEQAKCCGEGGVVTLFVAMVEYGRQLSKKSLRDGLNMLLRAERLYASAPQLGASQTPVLQHVRDLNEMQIGVSLYDSGRFDEARRRLERCVRRLGGENPRIGLPIALNYLAQLYIAIGAEDEAREALGRALEVEEERGDPSGWHAYNNALLALLVARVPERADEAVNRMEEAWRETTETRLANLVPLVRNLYVEVLIATGRDLDRAEHLAGATLIETERTHMDRSRIAAFSLRSRLRLRRGEAHHDAAEADARAALELLEQRGAMPALRTEEVYHDAAHVLRTVGHEGEAERWLERARGEVRRKAQSLANADDRARFLTAVPLNRALFDGAP